MTRKEPLPGTTGATESTEPTEVRLSEVVSALSHALDITEGQPEGHAVRGAIIGMRLAEELALPAGERSALFYALLLKDLGCSSNAARVCSLLASDDRALKRELKTVNWSKLGDSVAYVARHAARGESPLRRALKVAKLALRGPSASRHLFEVRCERGAGIARLIGFSDATAEAIRALDEHWDGRGYPRGLRGEEIPLLARILGVAQTAEVFLHTLGLEAMYGMLRERRGRWFDPKLVDTLLSIRGDSSFWDELASGDAEAMLLGLEPEDTRVMVDEARLDRLAKGFAQVIDAKSPWTFRHSEGVAEIAVGVARVMGFPDDSLRTIERAALLHDIGKLGVSNLVLDKPGRLTNEEWKEMARHPEYTRQILERVACFRSFADFASAHHERLDGRGYHRGLTAEEISVPTRILTVADIYEAMSAQRPYRPRQPGERVLQVMSRDVDTGICGNCFEALREFVDEGRWTPGDARNAEAQPEDVAVT